MEGTAWPEAWRHEATCPLWSPRLSSPLVGNLSPDCFPRLPWRRDTVYVWELALMLSTERKERRVFLICPSPHTLVLACAGHPPPKTQGKTDWFQTF